MLVDKISFNFNLLFLVLSVLQKLIESLSKQENKDPFQVGCPPFFEVFLAPPYSLS